MTISLNPYNLLNGEGLDVTSLVNQILNERSGQLSEWGSEQTLLRTQAGLLTSINTDLSSLSAAVSDLSDPLGALTAVSASSSNSAVLSANADVSAASGNHTVIVGNLASAGLVYTSSVSGGAAASILPTDVSSADLKLQIGGEAGATADIQIQAGANDTLSSLASYINQQSATQNWGIQAAVVTDATGARLSITSQATGTPGAIAVLANTTTMVFNPPVGGTNASLTIDGIPYSSATNTIGNAIAGVTLSLVGAAPNSPVQVNVGPDTSRMSDAITSFVHAYNQVISDINEQYLVDPATNTEGPLAADSSLRTLQSMLLNDVTHSVSAENGFVNLASLGINMNDDGTLTVGNTPSGKSMSQVLSENAIAAQQFFQNEAGTGFATVFHRDLMNLTDSTEGLLNVDLAQNREQQDDLADAISRFQDQLAAQQKQLTAQFSLVNASLQSYPLLLSQVTQTLATLDGNSNGAKKS
jgi:flagellar hook-associated protein 2